LDLFNTPNLLRREAQIRGEAIKKTARIQNQFQFIPYIIPQLTPKTQSIVFKLTGTIWVLQKGQK